MDIEERLRSREQERRKLMQLDSSPWQDMSSVEESANADPTMVGALPLWAASPRAALAPRSQWMDNRMLAQAIQNRYDTRSVRQAGQALSNEMTPGHAIHIQNYNGIPREDGGNNLGRAVFGEDRIDLDTSQPPITQVATLAHELGHKADHYQNMYRDPNPTDDQLTHHQYFKRIEPQLAQSMEAQSALERGLPVDPATLKAYPWLSQVRPDSSNLLATPWNFK